MYDKSKLGVGPRHKFHYSGYWHTWSRVLLTGYRGFQTVELNLTPVNGSPADWDEQVKPVIVRAHCTAFDRSRDKAERRLPKDVFTRMGKSLGEQLRDQLINTNFVDVIDWDLYDEVSLGSKGGGVPLHLIARGVKRSQVAA